jgi:hypothetical protein
MLRFPRPLALAVGVLTVVIMCLPAMAQPGGGGMGGGMGGMMGGMGGGMGGMFGGMGGMRGGARLAQVVASPEVQKAVGLTEEQVTKVTELAGQYEVMPNFGAMFGGMGGAPGGAPGGEAAAPPAPAEPIPYADLQKKLAELITKEKAAKLTDYWAAFRFKASGPQAAVQEPCRSVLSISDEQAKKMEAIIEELNTARQAIFQEMMPAGGGFGAPGGGGGFGPPGASLSAEVILVAARTAPAEAAPAGGAPAGAAPAGGGPGGGMGGFGGGMGGGMGGFQMDPAIQEKLDKATEEANGKLRKLCTEAQTKKIEELLALVKDIELPRGGRGGMGGFGGGMGGGMGGGGFGGGMGGGFGGAPPAGP